MKKKRWVLGRSSSSSCSCLLPAIALSRVCIKYLLLTQPQRERIAGKREVDGDRTIKEWDDLNFHFYILCQLFLLLYILFLCEKEKKKKVRRTEVAPAMLPCSSIIRCKFTHHYQHPHLYLNTTSFICFLLPPTYSLGISKLPGKQTNLSN